MAAQTSVAVLGLGRMGVYIAADFLLAGHDVRCTTSRRTSSVEAIARVQQAIGHATKNAGRLSHVLSTAEAARDAKLVVECLPEVLELKRQELAAAQAEAPDAIIATNSSSLTITSIADGLEDPSRLIGAHYVNPPWAYRLVELVAGERTDPAVVDEMRRILVSHDRVPVLVNRDVPGFVFNRIQFAVLREAIALIDADVISPSDLDRVMVEGLGRRWAITGPVESAALGGPDLFVQIADRLYPDLCNATAPSPRMRSHIASVGPLPSSRETRDRELRKGHGVPGPWQRVPDRAYAEPRPAESGAAR